MNTEKLFYKKRNWRSRNLSKPFTVRATEQEHSEIRRRADAARMSASRYLIQRGLVGRLPDLRITLPPSQEEREQLERILYALRKVGNNLNQLAHTANSARWTGIHQPAADEINIAAEQAKQLIDEVRKRL
jgi:uncharacterized membrane protein